jgi:hypothetical protein
VTQVSAQFLLRKVPPGYMTMRLTNEFASVEIVRDDRGNGPRLLIRDLQTGLQVYLDPLELAALASTRHDELLPLLDPGRLDRQTGTVVNKEN